MKPIHIFKPGQHTAMSGATLSFSEADLAASAAAYDPAVHEAPMVVGHPAADGPAYGWVKGLAFADAGLQAEPSQVDPAFAELVVAGRFKKVSASFYTPDAPNNPVPGVYYLRHVGFLGAQPPAIKGLRPVEFAEGEAGVIEFSEWTDQQNAGLWRRMREFLIAQFGQDKADAVIPTYTIDDMQNAAVREAATEAAQEDAMRTQDPTAPAGFPSPYYAEGGNAVTEQELKARKDELDAKEADLKKREAAAATFAEAQAAADQAARDQADAAFAEGLVAAGQLRPADKPRVLNLLKGLAPTANVMDFAEGSTTELVAVSARDVLKAFLKSQPKLVDFSERGKGDGTTALDVEDPEALRKGALAYQEACRVAGDTVPSFPMAVQHVTRQHKA
jgi:hypothetical protein